MKEIRAFIRDERTSDVTEALANAGFDFCVLGVQRIARGLDRSEYDFSIALGEEFEKISKLEIVCADSDVEPLLALIQRVAHTGKRGDGMIFVAPIEDAVRMSSGVRGEAALRAPAGSSGVP